jgi:hypothetical protein
MCSVSAHDLSIERWHMDNPPRHSCLPMVYFLLFWDYWCAFCLCSFSVSGHRFRTEDYCLMVYCEVGSILYGLLRGQGRVYFYFCLFYFIYCGGQMDGLNKIYCVYNLS